MAEDKAGAYKIKDLYGFLPISVWYIKNKGYWRRLIRDDYEGQSTVYKKAYKTDHVYVDPLTGKKYIKKIKYSEFHPILAERIIKFWSEKGDHIVDPFSGRITRATVSLALGRSYEGYEIGPKTHKLTLERMKPIIEAIRRIRGSVPEFKLWNDDGCLLKHTPDQSADFVFTCPPYWRAERYEPVRGQLSEMTYEQFLDMIRLNAQNVWRVLKWNKFAVYVVGDVRISGKFYPLHSDFANIFVEEGFELWDIIVNVLISPTAWMSATRCAEKKYTHKIHEYILVFKKVRRRVV